MKTILVPTDFSKNALNAVKYAIALSQDIKSKIILFHSYEAPDGSINMPLAGITIGKHDAKLIAERGMQSLITLLQKTDSNLKFKWIVQPGFAPTNIVEYVKNHKINLVVMGTTGQGAITRAIVGSTTSSVIKNASCNIIAVPIKSKYNGISKVAFATDLEKDNLKVVKDAVVFAKHLSAELTFIYVQDLNLFDAEVEMEKMIIKIKSQTKYKNLSYYVCRDSDVAKGLDYFLKKQKPDLLSMVTHRWKFPETIWKTSWTNQMSNHTTVPLLILHSRKPRVSKINF